MAFNQIRYASEKILADQEGRGLPLLSAEDYTPFRDAIGALLVGSDFMHEHSWETPTLEHSISRPTFDAKSPEDCNSKLDIRLEEGEEKDPSGTTVFDGSVVSIIVDGYTLAKGRGTSWVGDALLDVFQKILMMAREWE